MRINIKELQNFGALEPREPLAWARITTCKPLPSMFYHIEFGSSATKGMRKNRIGPQNWGAFGRCPLAVGAKLTPRNTPLPACVILPIVRSKSNDTSVIKKNRPKYLTLVSAFQGHSRSSEQTYILIHNL